MVTLFELFLSFFLVGAFSFGGGYASLPIMQEQIVNTHQWLTVAEFSDVISIAQMAPGAIAVNGATFVGTRIAGTAGAFAAMLGCILPSTVIVLLLAMLYKKYSELKAVKGVMSGLRPAVIGLIASAGASIMAVAFFSGKLPTSLADVNFIMIAVFAVLLVILRKFKLNPLIIIIAAGAAGAFLLP